MFINNVGRAYSSRKPHVISRPRIEIRDYKMGRAYGSASTINFLGRMANSKKSIPTASICIFYRDAF